MKLIDGEKLIADLRRYNHEVISVDGLEGLIELQPVVQESCKDADCISRKAVMKEFSDFVRESNNSDFAQTPTWNDAVSLVGSMPSAQPGVIRCKDCQHRDEYGCCKHWKGLSMSVIPIATDDDEFCSYAKRREVME